MDNKNLYISKEPLLFSDKKIIAYLTFFSFFAFYFLLNVRPFYGSDEVRVAALGLSFDVNNNWFVSAVNGQIFLHKPPLYFWLCGLAFKLFGVSYFSARFIAATSAALNVIVCYLLGRKMNFCKMSSLLGALSLISCAQFFMTGRSTIIDVFLSFSIGLSWYAFYSLNIELQQKNAENKKYIRNIILWTLLLTCAFVVGLMSKGVVGIVVPLSGIGIWMLYDLFFCTKKIRWALWICLLIAFIISFVPVAWWCAVLYRDYGYSAFKEIVIDNNLGRFFGSLINYAPDHQEPFYYYISKLHELFTPWVFFTPFMFYYYIVNLRKKMDSKIIFLLLILLIPFILFNVSSGKRRLYLLPLYMPLAMLFGEYIYQSFVQKVKPSQISIEFQCIFYYLMLVAAIFFPIGYTILMIIAVVKGVVAPVYITLISFVSIVVAVYTLIVFIKKRNHLFLIMIAVNTVFILIWSNDIIRTSYHTKKESYEKLAQKLQEYVSEDYEIILVNPRERLSGAMVYYLQRNVKEWYWGENKKIRTKPKRIIIGTIPEPKDLSRCYFLAKFDDRFAENYNLEIVDNFNVGGKELVICRLKDTTKKLNKLAKSLDDI